MHKCQAIEVVLMRKLREPSRWLYVSGVEGWPALCTMTADSGGMIYREEF
jgi:hypothetical protein